MYNIRVHFDNGDRIDTRINGDIDTIVNYYLDHQFPFLDDHGKETTAKARCVEFLDRPRQDLSPHTYRRIHRVYSLSEKYMKRHELYTKIRCSFSTPSPSMFISRWDTHDCAYVPSMFAPLWNQIR